MAARRARRTGPHRIAARGRGSGRVVGAAEGADRVRTGGHRVTPINKKTLSERDIVTKYVLPALTRMGWDVETQVREEVPLTPGRVIVKGTKEQGRGLLPWRERPSRPCRPQPTDIRRKTRHIVVPRRRTLSSALSSSLDHGHAAQGWPCRRRQIEPLSRHAPGFTPLVATVPTLSRDLMPHLNSVKAIRKRLPKGLFHGSVQARLVAFEVTQVVPIRVQDTLRRLRRAVGRVGGGDDSITRRKVSALGTPWGISTKRANQSFRSSAISSMSFHPFAPQITPTKAITMMVSKGWSVRPTDRRSLGRAGARSAR